MRIVPVPCLEDNYAYLVICQTTNKCAVIDPSEADPVLAALKREGADLVAIWNTHHHWDHTGGNKDLLEAFPELEVVGHESDKGRIPGQTTFASEGDKVTVGELAASIIFNPGHTTGAISYFVDKGPTVFTGDTLFAGGCGRIFEGTPEMMYESLHKLAKLPGKTKVYCGHEYTQANLRFASAAEPDNDDLADRKKKVDELRADGRPTVPFTIAEDRSTNPFLRSDSPELIEQVKTNEPPKDDSPVEVFAATRRWKDRF